MRFQIGQQVVLLDGILEGKVLDVTANSVLVVDSDGLQYQFHPSELVVKNTEQQELSKYSDINNKMLFAKERTSSKRKSLFKKNKKEMIMEVDLHIEKLVKSTRGMNSTDIINKQLDIAEYQLKFALQKRFQKIIFIHGVGEGILKSELERLLQRYSLQFYAASYKKYGMGATEVSLTF